MWMTDESVVAELTVADSKAAERARRDLNDFMADAERVVGWEAGRALSGRLYCTIDAMGWCGELVLFSNDLMYRI